MGTQSGRGEDASRAGRPRLAKVSETEGLGAPAWC